jgi:hypothetical protein
VASSCEYGDEPSGSGATELVIRVERGVKFMKHFKGAQAIEVWEPLIYTVNK